MWLRTKPIYQLQFRALRGLLDFRKYTSIGKRIEMDHEQLKFGKGYDHTWLVGPQKNEEGLSHAATLRHQGSGRVMKILPTNPVSSFTQAIIWMGRLLGMEVSPMPCVQGCALKHKYFQIVQIDRARKVGNHASYFPTKFTRIRRFTVFQLNKS